MPTYEIQAPDGNKYRIDGPAGATDDQVREQVLKQHPNAGTKAAAKAEEKAPEPTWGRAAGAVGELGLTLASGLDQQVIGVPKHVAQLAESVTSGLSRETPEQKAQEAKANAQPGITEKLQQAVSYQPQSFYGKKLVGDVASALKPVAALGQRLHEGVAGVIGEPATNVAGDILSLAGAEAAGGASTAARALKAAESTESRVGRIVENLSGGKSLQKADVGAAVKGSLTQTTADLKKSGSAAYQELDKAMDAKTQIPLTKSAEAANEYTTRTVLDPKVKAFSDKLRAGEMSFEDLKALRTEISDNMGTDRNVNRQLRGLRNAVTQDIDKAAESLSPEAKKAWDSANSKWKDFTAKEDEINRALGRKWEGKTPSELYQKVLNTARTDPEKIGNLVNSIKDPAVRKQLAGSVLHHMSDTGGKFDGDKLVRNWDNMNPQARKALFDSVGGDYEKNMTKLVENLRRIREGHRGLVKEVSGVGVGALISHFVPGGTLAFGAATLGREAYKFGPKALESYLTSPKWVKYLAEKTSEVPERAAGSAVVASRTLKDQPGYGQ
jgi:hypothetical protein